ncbi:hypothetical protein Phou_023210 [Phytohabitans houttuyneae]|uniref:Uncharacterized protein n=1 Tax=Phytohabitans houttuyneae TaxID=1076126 RepID=A0A6V8K6U2_9ACTN|nr:hypothetical protein Phou_023210 [Phytohabitans houttuyneae]
MVGSGVVQAGRAEHGGDGGERDGGEDRGGHEVAGGDVEYSGGYASGEEEGGRDPRGSAIPGRGRLLYLYRPLPMCCAGLINNSAHSTKLARPGAGKLWGRPVRVLSFSRLSHRRCARG